MNTRNLLILTSSPFINAQSIRTGKANGLGPKDFSLSKLAKRMITEWETHIVHAGGAITARAVNPKVIGTIDLSCVC